MELKNALQLMQHYITEDERRPMKLAIVVTSQGSLGGTPCVEVQSIHAGIDWDNGKLMIHPAQPLTALTAEDVADIRKSVAGGQSWHAYQAYKKHQEQLKAVEAQRDTAHAILRDLVELVSGVGGTGDTLLDTIKLAEIADRAQEVVNG